MSLGTGRAPMLTGIVKSAFHLATAPIFMNRLLWSSGIERNPYLWPPSFRHADLRPDPERVVGFCKRKGLPGFLLNGTPGVALLESTGPIASPALKLPWEQQTVPVKRGGDRIRPFYRPHDRSGGGLWTVRVRSADLKRSRKACERARLCPTGLWERPPVYAAVEI
jgi:hypothetical protein